MDIVVRESKQKGLLFNIDKSYTMVFIIHTYMSD